MSWRYLFIEPGFRWLAAIRIEPAMREFEKTLLSQTPIKTNNESDIIFKIAERSFSIWLNFKQVSTY